VQRRAAIGTLIDARANSCKEEEEEEEEEEGVSLFFEKMENKDPGKHAGRLRARDAHRDEAGYIDS
jgi:hypothetical protein